jgi:hypothetical protein
MAVLQLVVTPSAPTASPGRMSQALTTGTVHSALCMQLELIPVLTAIVYRC